MKKKRKNLKKFIIHHRHVETKKRGEKKRSWKPQAHETHFFEYAFISFSSLSVVFIFLWLKIDSFFHEGHMHLFPF